MAEIYERRIFSLISLVMWPYFIRILFPLHVPLRKMILKGVMAELIKRRSLLEKW